MLSMATNSGDSVGAVQQMVEHASVAMGLNASTTTSAALSTPPSPRQVRGQMGRPLAHQRKASENR